MAYNIVWEFRVRSERVADFEAAYGPLGTWARLFEQADGFLAVELLRSTEEDGRYLTIDSWASETAFKTFRTQFAAGYEALDKELAGFAMTETRVGAFSSVEPLDAA
jgi:heme-degrading monooxygenase HmoA